MSVADQVVRRFLAARWDNSMNGTYVTVHWNKALWQVEESETPISSSQSFIKTEVLDTYTLPTLVKELAGRDQEILTSVTPATVRQYAHIKMDDKGPIFREKMLKAYEEIFAVIIQQWKEEGDLERLRTFEKLLPNLRRKLVWKKVA